MKLRNAVVVTMLVMVASACPQAAGTFPAEPFNGMQLTYSVSGMKVSKTTDTPGFTTRRDLEGALGDGELIVSGKATMTSGWGYRLTVSARAGNKEGHFEKDYKTGETAEFKVVVPIGATAANGNFSISMVGEFSLGGAGSNRTTRGLMVGGIMSMMGGGPKPDTKPNPELSNHTRLKMLLDKYLRSIPNGNFGSGSINNLFSWIPFTSRFDDFVCGGYQAKVLAFLDAAKWSNDPEMKKLFDAYDYGPIEAYYGGHQAVVIYPKGKDWITEGIVLDPWITQSPKTYTIQEWAGRFGAHSYYGIRGSSPYVEAKEYPTCGGTYVKPGERKLTKEEMAWISSLPPGERAKVQKITDPNLRSMIIKNAFRNKKLTSLVGSNCPVSLAVRDPQGRMAGFTNAGFKNEIPGVKAIRLAKGENDWATLIWYDPALSLQAVVTPLGAGSMELVSGQGLGGDGRCLKYSSSVRTGVPLTLSLGGAASLLGGTQPIKPTAITPKTSNNPIAKLMDNGNTEGVLNGPTHTLSVSWNEPLFITEIETYHWNSGRGDAPGTIQLVNKETKKVYGPWQAVGSPGQGGVQNAYWKVTVDEVLPAGSYDVVVSNPASWSYNPESKGVGFIRIWGRRP